MAAAMLRLRATAAVGSRRKFASSAVGLMLPSSKMYCLREKKVVNMNISSNIEKELESDYVVGSSHGWVGLMKMEKDRVQCGSSSGVSLWNPMSGSRMMLPPVHTIRRDTCRLVERVMVDDSECSRAIVVGSAQWLGACWPGRCREWTVFGEGVTCEDVVVACSQSRVYTVDCEWEMERWNVSDPRRPKKEWKKDLNKSEKKFPRTPEEDLYDTTFFHLVFAEHSGQLFLLSRHYALGMEVMETNDQDDTWNAGIFPSKTLAFDVHLVVENETTRKVEAVRYMEHSLDGLVMFVGINNSLAVPAADFPHLKPDSIYFTEHVDNISPRWYDDIIYEGYDVGIYDYKNRTISSCYYPGHHQALKRIHPPPFWLTG